MSAACFLCPHQSRLGGGIMFLSWPFVRPSVCNQGISKVLRHRTNKARHTSCFHGWETMHAARLLFMPTPVMDGDMFSTWPFVRPWSVYNLSISKVQRRRRNRARTRPVSTAEGLHATCLLLVPPPVWTAGVMFSTWPCCILGLQMVYGARRWNIWTLVVTRSEVNRQGH